MSFVKFVREDDNIIFSFPSRYQKETKKRYQELFSFNIRNGGLQAVSGKKYGLFLEKYFSSYKSPYSSNPGITAASQIRAAINYKPLSEWGLPDPLDYDANSAADKAQMLIRGEGDRAFRAAALREVLKKSSSSEIEKILVP